MPLLSHGASSGQARPIPGRKGYPTEVIYYPTECCFGAYYPTECLYYPTEVIFGVKWPDFGSGGMHRRQSVENP